MLPLKVSLSIRFLFLPTPLRDRAFHQLRLLYYPYQCLFFILGQLIVTKLGLFTEHHQKLFCPASFKGSHFFQILPQFFRNRCFQCAVTSSGVGVSDIFQNIVHILMYPATEIVPFLHMGRLQQIHGFVLFRRLVLFHDFSPCHIHPCV